MKVAEAVSPPGGIQSPIVLFDGVCNFCNRTVQFILRRDRREMFRFAPLQSPAGKAVLEQFGLPSDQLDSLVLIENEGAHFKSTAALRIVRRLRGLWPMLFALVIVPRPIRDFLYEGFASRRYRWFGKKDHCMVPSPQQRDRFLM